MSVRWVSVTGSVLAALMFGFSLDPSLLVRDLVFQGVLSGVGIALGYGVGALVGSAGRRLAHRSGREVPRLGRRERLVAAALVVAYATWTAVRAVGQHRWTWERLDYSPTLTATAFAIALLIAAVVASALLLLGWAVRVLQTRVSRVGARVLPAWIAAALGLVVVLWALLAAADTWVLQRTLDGMNRTFESADLDVDDRAPAQPSPLALRSGTALSAASWAEAGHEGRRFLSRGAQASEIAELAPDGSAAAEAQEPVRVYVGRASADTVDARVDLAMREMERLDAFERDAVLVVVPTGTGWVNEQIVAPVEHLLGGDVATVSVQYSHLPSPLAYVAEGEAAGDTGAALVDAVRARVSAMPAAGRPDVLVVGESLGSFGASRAFDDLDEMLDSVDRTLWVGPPESMTLRREAEDERAAGSPQIKPVVGDGREIVFANRRSDLVGTSPRSVFLQQADDPIVWWDVPTIVRRPDWLSEPLDPSVNPAMTWHPVSTFAGLTVDMAVGNDFDEDHGHLYGTQPLAAWAVMLQPAGWDADDLERLRERLAPLSR
ncbi:alpha/beta-hydrolase family protein [Solicola sp. PLA-1-18]|uniref:alpha/beta-hydrolase family protein n=1 Tax=Solicola sp. PLA-1-18 TaxID=3380532 RepID=UPI003B760305